MVLRCLKLLISHVFPDWGAEIFAHWLSLWVAHAQSAPLQYRSRTRSSFSMCDDPCLVVSCGVHGPLMFLLCLWRPDWGHLTPWLRTPDGWRRIKRPEAESRALSPRRGPDLGEQPRRLCFFCFAFVFVFGHIKFCWINTFFYIFLSFPRFLLWLRARPWHCQLTLPARISKEWSFIKFALLNKCVWFLQ